MNGVVSHFDDAVGLGQILSDDAVDVPFHCVAIADGSRSIRPGQRVAYELRLRFGRYEAANIQPA